MTKEDAKEWNLGLESGLLENKNLTSINGVQYFKENQTLELDGNPLVDYNMLDSMNVQQLYLNNTGIKFLTLSNKVIYLEVSNNPDLDSICLQNDGVISLIGSKDDHTNIYVNCSAEEHCLDSESGYYIPCDQILNIKKDITTNDISYPNPATSVLHINNVNAGKISILSLEGTTLMEKTVENIQVDISSLSPGQYFLQIVTDEVFTKTFGKE